MNYFHKNLDVAWFDTFTYPFLHRSPKDFSFLKKKSTQPRWIGGGEKCPCKYMNGLQTSLWGGCCPKFYASPHLTPLIGSKWLHPNAFTLQCHIDLSVEYFFPSHMGQILQNWENLSSSSIYEMMNMTEVILHFQPGRLKGKRNVNCQALETWPRYVSNAGWSFWIAVKVHQMMNLTFFQTRNQG